VENGPNLESRVGSVLGGTYRLERVIAEGGMGVIYQAAHLRVPRRFAVKLLNPQVVGDREVFERFQREAEIASALGHENIVQVFDFNYSEDGVPYMVLELLQGEDLSERIARRGRLSVGEVAVLLEQVCSALQAAHERGIVHRDLKPQNIFLCRQGRRDDVVKILDFGISKILHAPGRKTHTGAIFGTPNYMAPEQAEGRQSDIDRRSDIFSLGAILYECLTGHMAFDAPTAVGAIYKVCHVEPEPISTSAPEAPAALEAVIRKAIAKRREDRFQSVHELASAFFTALGWTAGSVPVGPAGVPGSGPIPVGPAGVPGSGPIPAAPQGGAGGGATALPHPGTWPPGAVQGTEGPGKGHTHGTPEGPVGPGLEERVPPARRRVLWAGLALGIVVVAGLGIAAALLGRGPTSQGAPSQHTSRGALSQPTVSSADKKQAAPADAGDLRSSGRGPVGTPQAATVTLKLVVEPKDATVEVDGVVVSERLLTLPKSSEVHRLTVSAAGYIPQTRELRPVADGEILVKLQRKEPPRHKAADKKPRPQSRRGPLEEDL